MPRFVNSSANQMIPEPRCEQDCGSPKWVEYVEPFKDAAEDLVHLHHFANVAFVCKPFGFPDFLHVWFIRSIVHCAGTSRHTLSNSEFVAPTMRGSYRCPIASGVAVKLT